MAIVVEKLKKSVFNTPRKFRATLDWQTEHSVDFVCGIGATEEDAVESLVLHMTKQSDVSQVYYDLVELAVNGWKAQEKA